MTIVPLIDLDIFSSSSFIFFQPGQKPNHPVRDKLPLVLANSFAQNKSTFKFSARKGPSPYHSKPERADPHYR